MPHEQTLSSSCQEISQQSPEMTSPSLPLSGPGILEPHCELVSGRIEGTGFSVPKPDHLAATVATFLLKKVADHAFDALVASLL